MASFGIAEPVGPLTSRLGEGPRWDADAGRLLWVDIEGGRVHVRDRAVERGSDEGERPGAGERAIDCGSMVGAVSPWAGDVVLAALAGALAAVDLREGSIRRLAAIPHGRPGMRCNDGACDAAGRFWIGTMALDESQGAAALYRYDPDGALHTVLTGVTLSNGLGWDAGGSRMFYVDSPTQRVDVLDFDGAYGSVSNRRGFAAIPEADGIPDGLAVDDEDGVWVALHGGGRVIRFDPDGTASGHVEVPVERVTACCFAGNRLFVTAREGLFALDVPYSGPPARPFGGPLPTG